MIPSMFNLDHRLAELRPSADELRIARQLREAAEPAIRTGRTTGESVRGWRDAGQAAAQPSRLATR